MLKPQTAKRLLKKISSRFGVKIVWTPLEDCGAQTLPESGLIEINSRYGWTESRLVSYVLHEIVHILCWKEGKYKVFHSGDMPDSMTTQELWVYISTAWAAERYVDDRAELLMSEMFPDLTFWRAYGRLQHYKSWMDTTDIQQYKKELRRRKLRSIDRKLAAKGKKS